MNHASTLTPIASVLMLQMVIAWPSGMIGPIWSIAPEWWHYMIAPAFKRMPSWSIAVLIVGSWIAFMLIHPPDGHGIDWLQHGLGFVVLSWMWLSGFLYFRHRTTRYGILLLLFPSTMAAYFGHFTGLPLFLSLIVLAISDAIALPASLTRCFNWLGDCSHPLYLFHTPAFIAVILLGFRSPWVILAGGFGLSLFMLYAIDYPDHKLASMIRSGKIWKSRIAERASVSAETANTVS